ncbi:hypothetical protein LY474_08790 [Myxococcus stipitatus]|uniref:hypothetical protein n=1 Tax=Myxococcus stipitatus TaxID=83455 RepID=UPI001F2ABF09|nr:hypothetical protein [Myxococcus stipitatus]MCE9667905.1 hypothetical protein [Myxococcus stipitatus]
MAIAATIGSSIGWTLLGISVVSYAFEDDSTCPESREDCHAAERQSLALPRTGPESHRVRRRSLTLTPPVGTVGDRAVVGFGGRF